MTPILYTIDPGVSSTNSRVHSKLCDTSKNQYTVLNYEKGFVCFDDTVSPVYRSVVLDANTQTICAFSPPKSSTILMPYERDLDPDTWMVNEIIEGSMMNLWYDHNVGCWEISTKNNVGGEYVYVRDDLSDGADTDEFTNMPFIGQVTYKNMFLDAMCEGTNMKNIKDQCHRQASLAPDTVTHDYQAKPVPLGLQLCLKEWDTQYSYSFVLQHPQNHLVLNIDRPRLYLVAVYRVRFPDEQPKNVVEMVRPDTYLTWKWLESCKWIYYPQKYVSDKPLTYTNLLQYYTTIHGSSDVVGVMMTNLKTGTRHKIINSAYKERKNICRNNPGLFYQYLCIRYVNKLDDFLVKSPAHVPIFERFNVVVAQFLCNIYRSYQSRYMKRTGEIISHRYMPHVYNIHHTIYLPSVAQAKINGTKSKITRQSVETYLKELPPTELYHAIYTF